jgi:hypothetical protein
MTQMLCEQSFHRGGNGLASCFWTGTACKGCGPGNERNGLCMDECRVNTCAEDPTRVFAGPAFSGTSGGACRQFDGNQTSCNNAFTFGDDGFASCFYNSNTNECRGCGSNNEGNGACTNTCLGVPACPGGRTIFTGHPGSEGCHRFDNDPAMCAQAYVEGGGGVASCWYNPFQDECNGCGPENANAGRCTNVCAPPPTCPLDSSRTFGGCEQFNDNPTACNNSFQLIEENGGPVSCIAVPSCLGCGLNNQAEGRCENMCFGAVENVAPAPVLSRSGLIAAVILLVGLAGFTLRQRRRA